MKTNATHSKLHAWASILLCPLTQQHIDRQQDQKAHFANTRWQYVMPCSNVIIKLNVASNVFCKSAQGGHKVYLASRVVINACTHHIPSRTSRYQSLTLLGDVRFMFTISSWQTAIAHVYELHRERLNWAGCMHATVSMSSATCLLMCMHTKHKSQPILGISLIRLIPNLVDFYSPVVIWHLTSYAAHTNTFTRTHKQEYRWQMRLFCGNSRSRLGSGCYSARPCSAGQVGTGKAGAGSGRSSLVARNAILI